MVPLTNMEAGAGKTFLVSKVIDNFLLQSSPEASANPVVYFYCNRNENDRRNPENILRSFIRQLSTPALDLATGSTPVVQKEIMNLKHTLTVEGTRLDIPRSTKLLTSLIDTYATVTFVLDAMDECNPENRQELLDAIDHLAQHSHHRARFFISSRPDDDIRRHFQVQNRPRIEVEATCTQGDITIFVDKELQQRSRLNKLPSELKANIRKTLLEQNEGMFQWVALQIDQLSRCLTSTHVQELLGKLPKGLDNTYRYIDNRIREDPYRKEKVARVVQWLMCSVKPLTTKRIAIIMVIDPTTDDDNERDRELEDKDVISDICCNLLRCEKSDGSEVWRFCHLSAREYFERYYYSPGGANNFVSASCLKALMMWGEDDNGPFPYPCNEWYAHVRATKGQGEDNEGRLIHFLKLFLGSLEVGSSKYWWWIEQIDQYQELRRRGSRKLDILSFCYGGDLKYAPILTICCVVPVYLLSDWWMEPDIDLNRCGPEGRSLLSISLMWNNVSVWKQLLRQKVSLESGSRSALLEAIVRGNDEQIDALLEAGADVNYVGLYDSVTELPDDPMCCLSEAARRNDIDTMRKLIQHGADVNLQLSSTMGETPSPLMAACLSRNNAEAVLFLLENGAQVDRPYLKEYDEYHTDTTPLRTAISYRSYITASILVDHGASTSIRGSTQNVLGDFKLPCEGNELLRKLIGMGLRPPDLYACVRDTIFNYCCRAMDYGDICIHRTETLEILFDLGVDINEPGNGSSVLAQAAHYKSIPAINFALDRGANINLLKRGRKHESAILAAASAVWAEGLKLLIARGADVNQNTGHTTPLIQACGLRYCPKQTECIRILLEAGANVNAVCPHGDYATALTRVMRWRYEQPTNSLQLLMEAGANINLSNPRRNPLCSVVESRNELMTEVLLEMGADPNVLFEEEYGIALAAGACQGCLFECELLLEAGARTDLRLSGWFRNVMEAALYGIEYANTWRLERSFAILHLLLRHGADPPMPIIKSPEPSAQTVVRCRGRDLRVRSTFGSHVWPLKPSFCCLPPIWATIIWRLATIRPDDFRRTLAQRSFPQPLPPFYVVVMKLEPYGNLKKLRPQYAIVVLSRNNVERFLWSQPEPAATTAATPEVKKLTISASHGSEQAAQNGDRLLRYTQLSITFLLVLSCGVFGMILLFSL
ncbi:hypothetical protein ACHAPJ_008347 [Fusarium lateritium]